MEGVLPQPVRLTDEESAILAKMNETIYKAGGGFTPRKRLTGTYSTEQVLMFVCNVCTDSFSQATNSANLRRHKSAGDCTRYLQTRSATSSLAKFLTKRPAVSTACDGPPTPAIVCRGFYARRVSWHNEHLDVSLLHGSTTAYAEWYSEPHARFEMMRRDLDDPVEYVGAIRSKHCTHFATQGNTSTPNFRCVCFHPPFCKRDLSVNI